MKRKITKAEHDALSDDMKPNYKADGDSFVLELEDDEDVGALKRAKDRETQNAKELREKLTKLETEKAAAEKALAEQSDIDARKRGDIKTLEKSWQDKYDKRDQEASVAITKRDTFLRKTLVDNVATKVAGEMSTVPTLLANYIRGRLTVDLDGDEPVTKVLDANGQVSALTIDELRKEIVANKEFAPILIGSKATGSGAPSGRGARPGGAPPANVDPKADLSKLDGKALAEAVKARRSAAQAAREADASA